MNRLTQAQPLHKSLSLILFGSTLLWVPTHAHSDPRFSTPRTIAQGDKHLAAGDINGDQNPDLVIARRGKLSVLLGDGKGRFATKLRPVPKGTKFLGQIPVLADFNGDGKLDLAALRPDFAEPRLTIFLGSGDGKFVQGAIITTTAKPEESALVAADINGDGKTDLAVRDDRWHFSILLGQGNGSFTPASDEPVALPDDPANGGFIAADINGDGKSDLILTGWNLAPGKLRVLLGHADGLPQIADAISLAAYEPVSVTAADFDGDGRMDLATANKWDVCVYSESQTSCIAQGGNLTLLRGHGDGSFDSEEKLHTAKPNESVAAADMDGDGAIDLITGNPGSAGGIGAATVSVLLNQGSGTFEPGQAFRSKVNHPGTILPIDMTNDSRPDLLVTPNPQEILPSRQIRLLVNRTTQAARTPLAGP